jgi:hypothetical protein
MCAMWPTTSDKKYVYVNYIFPVATMTGREREAISLEGIETISDLISKLDEKYSGIKNLFMPPDDIFNVRTMITLRRGQRARGIGDPGEKIEEGDIITLW